jgi:hypothetical protein
VLHSVIVVVPACCVAYLLVRAPTRLGRVLGEVVGTSGRMGDEVLILTASTIFGAAMAGLAIPDGAAQWLRGVGDLPWLVIGLAVAVITALGMLGLHPMVSASVIVPGYVAIGLPVADLVLSHIVVLAWSLSAMVAAWTLPLVVTSAAFDVPVRRLVFGANLRFVVIYGFAAVCLLVGLNALLIG